MDRKHLLFGQGAYYLVTGLWPLLHLPSFEAVTGPKTDDWLVRMVGCLAAVIGAALAVAALRPRGNASETTLLAGGSAGAFALIDVWYVAVGRIAPVYLADAVLEMGFLIGLILTRRKGTVSTESPSP